MRGSCRFVLAIFMLLTAWQATAWGQKNQEPEKIPLPKQKLAPEKFPPAPQVVPGQQIGPFEVPGHYVLPSLPPPQSRAGWQYYGVDSFGRMRPRVVLSPYGSYYLQTGEPYPWINNRSTAFMPYVAD